MRTRILCCLFACFSLFACDKEDDLSPSRKDTDWFSLRNDSDDPLDQYIYRVYEKTGVPILYSDTLGSEVRYNRDGNPYTHYEIIRMGYNLVGGFVYVGNYVLADDKENIELTVKLLDDYVFPRMPKSMIPFSYLVVDTLNVRMGGRDVMRSAYRDLTTTFVGRVDSVKKMNEAEKKYFANEIIAVAVCADLVKNYKEELTIFYKLTNSVKVVGLGNVVYGMNIMKSYNPGLVPEMCGLLAWRDENQFNWISPNETMDLEAYVTMILTYDDTWISQKYENYPVVLDKYGLLKKLVEDIL